MLVNALKWPAAHGTQTSGVRSTAQYDPVAHPAAVLHRPGAAVGAGVGLAVGTAVGDAVGDGVGAGEGTGVGADDGAVVGLGVGTGDGAAVGLGVGTGVGEGVGTGVGGDGVPKVTDILTELDRSAWPPDGGRVVRRKVYSPVTPICDTRVFLARAFSMCAVAGPSICSQW